MKKLSLISLGMIAVGSAMAQAQNVKINEVFINPPGSDNTQEFFELIGDANTSLAGLTFLSIEGDGSGAGTVDQAINLFTVAGGPFSLGSNGLFLWRDDASDISWVADDGSTVFSGPSVGTNRNNADFTPDLENGSNTFVLVSGFTGAVGDDLDTDNDGVLDSTPWTSVLDAIGVSENDGAANVNYGIGLGGFGFAANAGFNPDILFRLRDGNPFGGWVGSDVLGTNPGGSYGVDLTRYETQIAYANFDAAATFAGGQGATPGGANPKLAQPVPEPASMAILGLGALGLLGRRRRK